MFILVSLHWLVHCNDHSSGPDLQTTDRQTQPFIVKDVCAFLTDDLSRQTELYLDL